VIGVDMYSKNGLTNIINKQSLLKDNSCKKKNIVGGKLGGGGRLLVKFS